MPVNWQALLSPSPQNGPISPQNDYIARMLLEQGSQASPIQSPFQGLARLAQAYVGKRRMDADVARQGQGNQALADILAPPTQTVGNGPMQTAPLPPMPSPQVGPPSATPAMPGGGPTPIPNAPPGPPVPPTPIPNASGGPPSPTPLQAPTPNFAPPTSVDYSTPQISNTVDPKNAQIAQLLNSGIGQGAFAQQALQQLGIGQPQAPIKAGPGDVLLDPRTHQPIYSAPFKPDKPEADPEGVRTAKALFPNDPKAQHDYLIKNSPANLRSITNINNPKQNWQILTDPKSGMQYRYDLDSGKALTLDGQPYQPGGASKINSGTARSAAAMAAQKFMQEHPEATAQDLTQFAADYAKTNKGVTGFGTGKQGDQVRSLGVAVAHLNTLGQLSDALGNGNIQAFNKIGQAISQQTGSAAPTNFDTAKTLVANEITKAIIGAGGTGADRDRAQEVILRSNSPQQLKGAISTYQQLLGGQLEGLRQQYQQTTGRSDFDTLLRPETKAALEPPGGFNAPAGASETKTIGGVTYHKVNGQWMH